MREIGSKVLFLDRDGVINIDTHYVIEYEKLVWRSGIFDLVRHYNALGYKIIVVTNQSGISRGFFTADEVDLLHRQIRNYIFSKSGCIICEWLICPHLREMNCLCRKPGTGLFDLIQFKVDYENSIFIGDKFSDYQAAKSMGIAKIFVVVSEYIDSNEAKIISEDSNAVLVNDLFECF